MAISYTISAHERLVRVVAKGSVDFIEALATAAEISKDSAFSPEFDVVIDARFTFLADNAEGQRRFAHVLPDLWRAFQGRVAIVVEGGLNRLLTDITKELLAERGFRVELFEDLAAAEKWLAGDPP